MFSNGKRAVKVEVVEDLISELQRLPEDMPIGEVAMGKDLVVIKDLVTGNFHVEFDDPGFWTGDDAIGDEDDAANALLSRKAADTGGKND